MTPLATLNAFCDAQLQRLTHDLARIQPRISSRPTAEVINKRANKKLLGLCRANGCVRDSLGKYYCAYHSARHTERQRKRRAQLRHTRLSSGPAFGAGLRQVRTPRRDRGVTHDSGAVQARGAEGWLPFAHPIHIHREKGAA